MRARFAERHFEVTPNNLRQVRVPGGAEVLANRVGLAPGFHVRLGEAELFMMPGVPREMRAIFDESIAPRLGALVADAGGAAARRVWRLAGIGESHVDHRLRGLLDGVEGATLHFRIAFPENLVTVVVRRADAAAAEAVLDRLDGEVRARLGEHVYATGDVSLARAVGERLRARGETLATAESCTGGLVGDSLTDVPGSSDYYRGGVVAYSNALKVALLGVAESTLAAHGAVSEETVREMADGVRARLGADWAIAVSGVAGPGGGTVEKPVGLVWIAVAGPDGPGGSIETRRLLWPSERRLVKQVAASAALFQLHRRLVGAKRA
jgi:nicotinamide-nucleotide amidase